MEYDQKKPTNINYTKARIKPFLNPLFWLSSFIISVFFYVLWQYTQNPDFFTRETGRPSNLEPENTNSPETTENSDIEENLTENELSILADVDNINNLFEEVRSKSGEKNSSNNSPTLEDIVLNSVLTSGDTVSNSSKKGKDNLFQQLSKQENLGTNNYLITSPSDSKIGKIEVIKPQVSLPSLQDLTSRQQTAMERDPLREALQNDSIIRPVTSPNISSNTPLNLPINTNPVDGLTENSGVINNTGLTPINSNLTGVQGNSNNNLPTVPTNPYQVVPTVPTNPYQVVPTVPTNPYQTVPTVPTNPYQTAPTVPTNPYQVNFNNINSSVNSSPVQNQQNQQIQQIQQIQQPQQPQQPVRNQSGFLYYY
jgi:hypothetical protein